MQTRRVETGPIFGLAWCVGGLILARLLAYRSFPIFDDAFITYRYGANLASGHGLVYNLGEMVLGTTTPVFALLTGALFAVGLPPDAVVPFMNIGIDATIVILGWYAVFPDNRQAAIAFAALFALCPLLARVCVGGMEADFFVLQTLGALILHASGHRHAGAALAGASFFTRPEGVVTVAALIGADILQRRFDRAARTGAISALIAAPGLAFLKLTYGHVLPQSMAAKGLHPFVPPWQVLHTLLAPEPFATLVAVLAMLETITALRAPGIRRTVTLWLWLYIAAYCYGGPHIWSWYSFPALALAALLAASFVSRMGARLRLVFPAPLCAVGVVTAWIAVGFFAGPDRITRNVYRPVARLCRDVPAVDTILAYDIGIIGYRCPSRIIDAAGLVTPDAVGYSSASDLIQARQPDILFMTASADLHRINTTPWFAANYLPLARFAADGDANSAHMQNLGTDWRQEYIAYRRR